MKVRMCVSIAGHPEPRYDLNSPFSFAPGEEVDLHPELAAAWLASGHAEEIVPAEVPAEETRKTRRSARSQESE